MRWSRREDVSPDRRGVAQARVWVVVPCLGEPDRFFERVHGWLDDDGRCSVSIGGNSVLILEEWGAAASRVLPCWQSGAVRAYPK